MQSKAKICRDNGIAPSSLSTILKDSEKIRSAVDQGTHRHYRQQTSLLPKHILPPQLKDKGEGGGMCACVWEERSNS